MKEHLGLVFALLVVLLLGCEQPSNDEHLEASAISRNGFAREGEQSPGSRGEEIKIWGSVDHTNVYADPGTREILGEWWSG